MAGSFDIEASKRATKSTWKQDALLHAALRTIMLILLWYCLSTVLSMYNKYLVGQKLGFFGSYAFPAPLFMSAVQFAMQTGLARLTLWLGLIERQGVPMSWRDWSKNVLPNGITTGLDIGFSNKSLAYITMSFYTMCKSTTPIFLLLCAFIWGLERPSWELAGVVSVIVTGLLLLVKGEAEFHLLGFALVMTASALSGLRFTLTQLLLHGPPGGGGGEGHGGRAFGGPIEVVALLTPVMSATTMLLSLAWERPWASLPASPYFSSLEHSLLTVGIIGLGAVIAFLMVWTEYQVIKETSALTFMIAGTVKEVLTVLVAIAVFGDKFGAINVAGLCVVILGVCLFNWYKLSKMRQGGLQSIRQGASEDRDSNEEEALGLLEPPELSPGSLRTGSGGGSRSCGKQRSHSSTGNTRSSSPKPGGREANGLPVSSGFATLQRAPS